MYAADEDKFIPPQFNTWCGLSILAGAVERKVWLPWTDTFSYFPNIYVLLVSLPGDGKSAALNKATGLLQEVNQRTSTLNILPNQVTEAKFIELMGYGRSFTDTSSGKELIVFQNAGYYFASEASNSLRNVFGDFIACLTDFYDCPSTWERATKKDGKKIQLRNVCMNILAGSTFDYLGKLVNDENIMGGFASRLIYVVSKNKEVHGADFPTVQDPEVKRRRDMFRAKLVEDLTAINQLVGPLRAEPEFGAAWKVWYPEFERQRRKLQSEKTQSILARVNTNILKVSMLLCVAESEERILRLRHWERAYELVTTISEQTPAIFREAKAMGSDKSTTNITNAVLHVCNTTPGINLEQLHSTLVVRGFASHVVSQTIQAMLVSGGMLRMNERREIEVLGNAHDHL
jgi:hypothetical protein